MGKSLYNFRKIGGRKYKAWKNYEEGDYIIGKYTQSYEDNYNHTCWELQVIETNIDDFKVGDLVGINYTGSIAYKFEEAGIEPGQVVKLEYLGLGEMTKGNHKGKEFHDVDVAIAEEGSSSTIPDSDLDL